MSGEKIKFALVGAGNIANKYVDAFRNVKEGELAGIVTRNGQKAQAFADKHGIANCATDMRTLFERTTVDAVILATPNGLHADGIIEAAKFGKHALTEKPLDISVTKADAAIKACKDASVQLGVAFQLRTVRHYGAARDAIRSGKLGKILIANVFVKNYRGQDYYDSGAWRGTWKLDGGGPFMQQGSHAIDLMVWIMGPVKRVMASTKTAAHKIEVEDMGHAIVEYANGAQGIIEASTVVKPGYPSRFEFHGEKGSIILNEAGIVDWQVEGAEPPQRDKIAQGSGAANPMAFGTLGHELIIKDFIEAIKEGRPPMVSGESARDSVELICAIYESSRTRSIVEI